MEDKKKMQTEGRGGVGEGSQKGGREEEKEEEKRRKKNGEGD